MPTIKAVYEKQEDIPEAFVELYTERDGKFELTAVEGIQTQANVDRLEDALRKERNDHKTAKTALGVWGELKHDDVTTALARIPELEAQVEAAGDGKGKIDEEKMTELVEARVRTQLSPIQRQLEDATKGLAERDERIGGFENRERVRTIHDNVRAAMVAEKIVPTAQDDVLMLSERVFDVTDDKKVLVKDDVGSLPGADAKQWLADMREKRPHWWPPSQGGGANGGGGGGGDGSKNPWSVANWSLTDQGQYLKEHGREKADAMAARASSKVGAIRPTKKE